MIITKVALPRRTFLRGMGAVVAPSVSGCDDPRPQCRIERRASVCGGLYRKWRQHESVDSGR